MPPPTLAFLTQALGRVFYSIWVLAIPDTFCLVTVYTTYIDFQLVKREVKDGMYGLFSFIMVQLLIQIPMLFILSIVAIFPASFGIGNWPWQSFAPLLFVYTCKLWAIERMAMTCCIGVPDVLLGLLQFMVRPPIVEIAVTPNLHGHAARLCAHVATVGGNTGAKRPHMLKHVPGCSLFRICGSAASSSMALLYPATTSFGPSVSSLMFYLTCATAMPHMRNALLPIRFPVPHRWMLSCLRWSQSAITHLAIINTDNWEGAHRCDAATGFAIDGPDANVTNSTVAFCNANVDEDGNGFYCPDIEAQACFGRTGKQVSSDKRVISNNLALFRAPSSGSTVFQVLTSLSGVFDAVTAGDIWFDYAMLTIAIGSFFVLQAIASPHCANPSRGY